MNIFLLALVGAIMLAALILCFRIMRRGISTLDDDRKKSLARIKDGENKLAEEQKQVSAIEHLSLMRAAVEDLLRLADSPPGYNVESDGRIILLHTPKDTWRLELAMRESRLKTMPKVLHGHPRWLLSSSEHQEQHEDAASIMRSLHVHLCSETDQAIEPPQLARRIEAGQKKALPRTARRSRRRPDLKIQASKKAR